MDELKQLDGYTLNLDNGPDGDQHDDEDHDGNTMVDLPHVEGVSKGEPCAIQDELFDSDKDMIKPHHSTLNQDDVNLLSPLLDIPTKDRKIHYDENPTNEVVNTSED